MKLLQLPFRKLLDSIKASYWFVPALLLLCTLLLTQVLLYVDSRVAVSDILLLKHFAQYSPESGRAVLTAVATSMISVASIAFSITIVTLTLASSQFGPRLIRNFMMDRGTQFVLGFFLSTFIYCLLVIQSIKTFDNNNYVPEISVFFAVVLATVGVGILVYFIHHVAKSIQADKVINNVYCELNNLIASIFPDSDNSMHRSDEPLPALQDWYQHQVALIARDSGYIQMIDYSRLRKCARQLDIAVDIRHSPGDFICAGTPLAQVHFRNVEWESCQNDIIDCVLLGANRTPVQDPEYAIHQLVEIALRALSPGINDPYTAITVIDKLGAVMCDLTTRTFHAAVIRDDSGAVRVVTKPATFTGMGNVAFDQIRQSATSVVSVTIRLLETLAAIGSVARRGEQRDFVCRQVELIEQAQRNIEMSDGDRGDIERRIEAAGCYTAQ